MQHEFLYFHTRFRPGSLDGPGSGAIMPYQCEPGRSQVVRKAVRQGSYSKLFPNALYILLLARRILIHHRLQH